MSNSEACAVKAWTPDVDPDGGLTVWEDRQWVERMLDRLTPAQREIMELFLSDLTFHEISELLGKSPAAVRKNLQFDRERLRDWVVATATSKDLREVEIADRGEERGNVVTTYTQRVSDTAEQKS